MSISNWRGVGVRGEGGELRVGVAAGAAERSGPPPSQSLSSLRPLRPSVSPPPSTASRSSVTLVAPRIAPLTSTNRHSTATLF